MWVFLCMYLVVDWLLVIAVVALLEDATVRAECGWEGVSAHTFSSRGSGSPFMKAPRTELAAPMDVSTPSVNIVLTYQ